MVFEPRIMLMDEPLSALDKQLREHMQIELRQLHDKLGMTTVYVTLDQREALTMSDRIAVIQAGRIMQLDTPRALFERPVNRFVAEFIGESTFLPVQVAAGCVTLAGQTIQTANPPQRDGPQMLTLRPERLRLRGGRRRAVCQCVRRHGGNHRLPGRQLVVSSGTGRWQSGRGARSVGDAGGGG